MSLPDLPPLAALFLIVFDHRTGYCLLWKRAASEQVSSALEGLVEFRSLPSGLHTVSDDVVYWVLDRDHGGISAFVNRATDDSSSRNARMLAVGAVVPLAGGRLGRAWRHAAALKALAASVAAGALDDTDALQTYWERNGLGGADGDGQAALAAAAAAAAPAETPIFPSFPRFSIFEASRERLSPLHPARSLERLLDVFGPLVFPVYRAALLRKRILIACHVPVHQVCNFGG
jgi:hypothetical protein